MTKGFLELEATSAVAAFVGAKIGGKSDADAGAAALNGLSGPLKQALGSPGDLQRWKPLAMPLSELVADGTGSELPLVAPSVKHAGRAGNWDWTLQSDASLKLVADVLDSDQLATLGITPTAGHQIVRYAIEGQLGAATSGGASVGVWTLKAGAQASTSATMAWYIAAPDQARLGQALVRAVPFMVSPMNLGDQLERIGDFEYWGSSVKLEGGLSTSLSAEASLAGAGWTWGFDGERAKLALSIGVSGGARFKVGGEFRLRCIAKPAGVDAVGAKRFGLEVTLERLHTDSSSLALALSAGIDATALAQSADRYLRSLLPDPDKLDTSLTLLTNPGTAIGDELRKALESALGGSKLKDLVLVTAGFGDPKDLAKSLSEKLIGPLTDELDQIGGSVGTAQETLDSVVDRWIKRAFGDVPMTEDQQNLLRDFVAAQIDKVKTQLDQAIGKLATDIQGKSVAAATALLKPFATLGEKIQAQIADVSAKISASKAVEAVKTGLAEYTRVRSQILGVLSDAQRAKISLTLAGSVDSVNSNQTFFRGMFVSAADLGPAEKLFQALWSGRVDSLVQLVDAAKASGALVGEPEGWLVRSSSRTKSLSVTINFLGFETTNVFTTTSELTLRADLTGDVLATGKAAGQNDVQNYWTERHAKLMLSVIGRNHGVDFAFSGAYSAKGREVTPDMFNAMQRALVRVAGGSSTLDIRHLLKGPDGQSMEDKNFRRNVAFLLPISLRTEECATFLDCPADTLRRAIVVFGARALDAEYEGRWKSPPSAFLRDLSKALSGTFQDETAHLVAYLALFPRSWRSNVSEMDNKVYENLGLDPHDMIKGSELHRKLGVLFRLAVLVRSIVDLQTQMLALRGSLANVTLQNLQQAQSTAVEPLRRIADTLANFSVASSTLIGNDEMVCWPFATFAAAIAQICGRPVPPGFVACAVLPGLESSPVPLIAA